MHVIYPLIEYFLITFRSDKITTPNIIPTNTNKLIIIPYIAIL